MSVVAVMDFRRLFHHADDIDMLTQRTDIGWHGKPTVHEQVIRPGTGRQDSFDHGFQVFGGFDDGLFAPLPGTSALVHGFIAFTKPLVGITG